MLVVVLTIRVFIALTSAGVAVALRVVGGTGDVVNTPALAEFSEIP